jgi:hypothetical protein
MKCFEEGHMPSIWRMLTRCLNDADYLIYSTVLPSSG